MINNQRGPHYTSESKNNEEMYEGFQVKTPSSNYGQIY